MSFCIRLCQLGLCLIFFVSVAQAQSLRVITLAPHLTELVYALHAEDELVGVIDHSDYPPQARQHPIVGTYQTLNLEKILALKPDLVLSWSQGNPNAQLATLRQFGIKVVDSAPTRLNELAPFIIQLGQQLHREQQAKQLAKQLQTQLEQLKQHYHSLAPVRVFYQIWHQPLMTVAAPSWINDAIQTCGGINVFQHSDSTYPQINIEQVINRKPQAIIIADHQHQGGDIWSHWPQLTASQHLIWINPDLLNRFTPRLLQGVTQLCQAIDQRRNSR
ncbi:cobalamin-binding protein [Celerinatantimonas sp. YJH-8]|uniref:cobalamin-binding protein n=1 Tax=Celerinatantimonas sp. YJH-8 TaxID=3228714 RepID=UPI0038C7B3D5